MYKTPTFCFSYTCRIISGTSQNHKNPNLWGGRGAYYTYMYNFNSTFNFIILSSTPPPPRMLRVWDMRQNGISLSILINLIYICIIFKNLWLCFLYIDSLQSLSLFPLPLWYHFQRLVWNICRHISVPYMQAKLCQHARKWCQHAR